MALVCAQCSRVNPADASYCFFDGAALAGRAGGPINPGSAPFPAPFVFPTGQSCRNFDQFATTCQHHWTAAVDLLKQGYLASFFGGLGRVDLAVAAQEAAKFPDADRGLDQLLAKLPTHVLEAPKLQAEPRAINLGQITIGTDRATELHLSNLGMRLLYGSVASDSKWLTLGEGPGSPEKLFQFGAETVIPVHVKGQHLRAGAKPLEGKLIIDSNGGVSTVIVRAEVPITPFKGGLFDGFKTPRQIAEKSKANPKEAAAYFETGQVAAWFQSNGWTYPVQGPAMSGMGAVQQFFEALGVAKPPKVQVSAAPIQLQGEPGKRLEALVEVTSQEKKVVYGWATVDQPWLAAGATRLSGRTAIIPIIVPSVPDRAGTLEAKVTVTGNGNQKFVVPLRLSVIGGSPYVEEAPALEMDEIFDDGQTMTAGAETIVAAVPSPPPRLAAVPAGPPVIAPLTASPSREAARGWMHAVPLVGLAVVLLGLVTRDVVHQWFFATGGAEIASGEIDNRKLLGLLFDYNFDRKADKERRADNLSFGLTAYDPELGARGATKKLTYGDRGNTNSTLLKIDGHERRFGEIEAGKWVKQPEFFKQGRIGTFYYQKENIYVTQEARLIPGEPVEVSPGVYKRVYDTCFVRYKIDNRDAQPHAVGLRFVLDTYIGGNDAAPFTLPGVKGLVDTFKDLRGAEVPDFIQVLENPDLKEPGLIAQLNLKLDKKYEPPERVSLALHPQYGDAARWKDRWEVPLRSIREQLDSCVALYWEPKEVQPNQTRELAFSYGLGNVSIGKDARLGVTVGGAPVVGGELTVVALVNDPRAGQSVTLTLPPGLQLLDEASASQTLPPPEVGKEGRTRPSPVTWRLRAVNAGTYRLRVETGGVTQERQVTIGRSRLF